MAYNEDNIPIDLHKDGVLWLINRVIFHPRGFALGVRPDGGFALIGDGSEVWTFEQEDDDKHFDQVGAMFIRAQEQNKGE